MSYICSETQYKNSPQGIARINELRKVASLAGYKINESDFTFDNLLTFYLNDVDIPQTYMVDCYERLFEYRVQKIVKQNTTFIETTAKNPLASVTDSISNLLKGVATFIDYVIIILAIGAVFLGIYLITDFIKTTK